MALNNPIVDAMEAHLTPRTQMTSMTKVQDKGKKEFFKLVVLSIVMNQPPYMVDKLYEKDWREMFKRAERDKVTFNNYFEWITNDINKCLYSFDDFIDLDREYRRNSEKVVLSVENKNFVKAK